MPDSAESSAVGRARRLDVLAQNLPPEGAAVLGFRDKVRSVLEGAGAFGQIRNFADSGNKRNILRSSDLGLS